LGECFESSRVDSLLVAFAETHSLLPLLFCTFLLILRSLDLTLASFPPPPSPSLTLFPLPLPPSLFFPLPSSQVTFIREIPAYGAFYAGYEFSKRYFQSVYRPVEGGQLPIWTLMLSGATGGMSYWLASYPLGELFCCFVFVSGGKGRDGGGRERERRKEETQNSRFLSLLFRHVFCRWIVGVQTSSNPTFNFQQPRRKEDTSLGS